MNIKTVLNISAYLSAMIMTSSAIIPISAIAQDTEEASIGIEEIIVTARKREEQLQEVPISISAFTQDDIDARSISSLKQLGDFTPNFSFSDDGLSRNSGHIRIRGVGQSDSSMFFDPGVGVYIDGVYMARMRALDLDMMDIQRVEVLRGPQGTLFGKNTIGGALNIVSKRPSDEFSGMAEITAGSHDRIDGRASVNLPLSPGVLSARLTGVTRNRDGYGKRVNFTTGEKLDETGEGDSLAARALISWTPREDIDVLLIVDGSRSRGTGPVADLVATAATGATGLHNTFVDPDYDDRFLTPDKRTSFGTGLNSNDVDSWGIAINASWDLGSWALRSITSYRDMEAEYGVDSDHSPNMFFDQDFIEKQGQFSQEVQMSGLSYNDRLNWVAGFYYFQEDSFMSADTIVVGDVFPVIGLDLSQALRIWSDVRSWAGFGQGTFAITDKLSVTGGIRYTHDKKEVARERVRLFTGATVAPYGKSDDNWSAVTGRAGLEYQWTEDVMTYFSAARGYKGGGINGASANPSEHLPYDQETIWTYEIGLRSDLLDRRLRVNASAFFSDYQDLQFRILTATTTPPITPLAFVDNAGEAEVMGFELEITALPIPGLELATGIGYLDAEYTRLETGSPITLDDKFPHTPKWSWAMSAQYTMPVQGMGDLTGRLDYTYKSKVHHMPTNNPLLVQDNLGLLNARLVFQHISGKWEVAVFGTNLTDEDISTSGADLLTLGFAQLLYAPGRQWGASIKYNF
jgi:iron complex outermembrane recepter protein